jgi:hypothetical protein
VNAFRWFTPGRAVCGALLIVFGTVLGLSRHYPHDARLFPSIAGGAGLLLTVLLIIVDKPAPDPVEHAATTPGRTAIALLAAPVYAFLVWLAGFYVASFAVLIVLPWVLGFRRALILLAVALGGVAVLAGLFAGAMDMSLPQGLLGDWFLSRFIYDQ